nr:hypothetical protein [Proteus mirabilis]
MFRNTRLLRFQSLYAHNTNERFTQSLYEATDHLSDNVVNHAIEAAQGNYQRALIFAFIFMSVFILFTVFVMLWIRHHIVLRIKQVIDYMSDISQGNLLENSTIKAKGNNEIDQLINGIQYMRSELSLIVNAIREQVIIFIMVYKSSVLVIMIYLVVLKSKRVL